MIPGSIAVIITTFNSQDFVTSAISSVRGQTCTDINLIAVDNNSTDETRDLLTSLDVRFISEQVQGAGAARNAGLSHTESEFVLFLDSDDTLHSDALATLKAELMYSDAHAIYGKIRNRVLTGETHEAHGSSRGEYLEVSQRAPLVSSMLIRRSAFERYGVFQNNNFSFIQWVVHSRDAGAKFSSIDREVALRGIHGSNVSMTEDSMAEFFKIIRARKPGGKWNA